MEGKIKEQGKFMLNVVTSESMCTKYWLTGESAQEKNVVTCELTVLTRP